MTNEQIVERLKKLYDCKTEFSVTQTRKTSKKVNGLYKPLTHEIILHNKNFKTEKHRNASRRQRCNCGAG